MTRRSALIVLMALAMTLPALAQKPNLVFVMADDLGVGHLGCYGQKIIRTPNLDRMATEGLRFTQAYAGSAVCAPSRSVLMTDAVWCHEDLMRTAAELAGTSPPSQIDGVSLLPTLTGTGAQRRPGYRYWELQNGPRMPMMQAVRMGNFKGLRAKADAPIELYDLKADPAESRDVSSQHADVVARVERIMREARTEPRPAPPAQDFGGKPYR